MRGYIPLALAIASVLSACDYRTDPTGLGADRPSYEIIHDGVKQVSLEEAGRSLYRFNNCLTGLYPNYRPSASCNYNDIELNVASNANWDLVFLYFSDGSDLLRLNASQAIARLQTYKAAINTGYPGFVTCRARYATNLLADDLIGALTQLQKTGSNTPLPNRLAVDPTDAAGIFAEAKAPNGAPCDPVQPLPPVGNVVYSIWAGDASCKGTEALHWSGNSGFASSAVHSNGEAKISGPGNQLYGPLSYACGKAPRDYTGWNPPTQVAPMTVPVQYNASQFTCTFNFSGDVDLAAAGPWWVGGTSASGRLVDGVYCATGAIELHAKGVMGYITLIAGGDVSVQGSRLALRPYTRNLLAWAGGDLRIGSTHSAFWGTLYAPHGTLHLTGVHNSLASALLANRVQINGNNNQIYGAALS